MTQLLPSPEIASTPPEILKVQFLDLRIPDVKYLVTASVRVVGGQTDIAPDVNDSSVVKLARFVQGVNMLAGERHFYDPARGNGILLFQDSDYKVHGVIKTERSLLGRNRMTYLGLEDVSGQTIVNDKRRVDNREQFSFGPGMRITAFVREVVPSDGLAEVQGKIEHSEHAAELNWLYNITSNFLGGQDESLQDPRRSIASRTLGKMMLEGDGF